MMHPINRLLSRGVHRSSALMVLMVLLLSACGGGSSSSGSSSSDSDGQSGNGNPPPPPPGSAFENDKTVLIADTRIHFTSQQDLKSRDFVDGPGQTDKEAEVVVYLPDVPGRYRGVLFFDGSSKAPRYSPGYVAEVWQFVSIAQGWGWQERVHIDDPDYLPTLLQGIADYTGRPEIAKIPWAFVPRQFGKNDIIEYAAANHDRVIGVGLGFGDNKRAREFSKYGFPVSYAHEVRHNFDKARKFYEQMAWEDGSLISGAGEQGYSRHYNNSKPEYGMMLLSRAVLHRLMPARVEADGTTHLVDMKQEDGWLGAMDPLYSDFNQIAPFADFEGSRTLCSWLADEEFAVAWRGYMTPDPLIDITEPTSPQAYRRKNNLGQHPLLEPGPVTFSWKLFEPISSTKGAHLSQADSDKQGRIERVDLYQGGRHLGGADSASGSITADFGPGVHLVVAIATLDDGEQHSSWPIGFGVRGDMYSLVSQEVDN